MRKIIVLVATFFVPALVDADVEKFESELAALVSPLIEERLLPGFHLSVYREDGLVFQTSVGSADDKANLKSGPDVLYFLDSMSKPLTGLLLARLFDKGLVDLDEPIEKYLPEFQQVKIQDEKLSNELSRADSKITIRQLLTHTSGLTHTLGATGKTRVANDYRRLRVMTRNSVANSKLGDLSQQVAALATLPLVAKPGARFEYSVGFDVAGRIVEVVTGKDLATAMNELVLRPLGMLDTYFVVPPEKHARLAQLYAPHGRTYQVPGKPKRYRKYAGIPKSHVNFGVSSSGYFSGTIGMISTAADYSKFLRMLLNNGNVEGEPWLSAEGLRLLTENQLPDYFNRQSMSSSLPDFSDSAYSFGMGIKLKPNGVITDQSTYDYLYWASGSNTQFFVDTKNGLAAIFMTQHAPARYFFIDKIHELANLFLPTDMSSQDQETPANRS